MAHFKLSDIEMDELLTEIITGKRIFVIGEEVFGIRQPISSEKDNAKLIYMMKYKKLISKGLLTREQIKIEIIKNEILESNFYSSKKRTEEQIEKMVKVRGISGSPEQILEINMGLHKLYDRLQELETREEILLINSAETNAEEARQDYLMSMCLLTGYDLSTRYWKTYEDYCDDTNSVLRGVVRKNYFELLRGISAELLRAVARSDGWRKRWEISKKTGTQIFEGTSANWDKNKVELCYWSNFYDSIFECQSPPPDEVVSDDDKLFEWIRQRNNKGETKESDNSKEINTPYKVRMQ